MSFVKSQGLILLPCPVVFCNCHSFIFIWRVWILHKAISGNIIKDKRKWNIAVSIRFQFFYEFANLFLLFRIHNLDCNNMTTLQIYTRYIYQNATINICYGIIFVGSRACATNHYVIAEKCGYVCPHVHIFGERRFSERVPIRRSI